MILGRIVGKVSTTDFRFTVTSPAARKFQFIQIHHVEYGFVLGQIRELERTENETMASCLIVGYKDEDGRVKGIRTPFVPGTEILEADDEFITQIIDIGGHGAYVGKLEGKDIAVHMDLQKVLTRHLAVLAKSGAGKSYTVGCLVEEIMDKRVPLLVIDPHGEYSSMKEPAYENREILARWGVEPKGYSLNIQEYGDTRLKNDVRPLKLSEKMSSYELMKMLPVQLSNTQEAMLFSIIKDLEEVNFDNIILHLEQLNSPSKWTLIDTLLYLRDLRLFSSAPTPLTELISPGKCSVLNLKGITPEVQDVIVAKLLKDLFLARKQEKIPPFFCVIEEAHNFAPEKGFGKAKSLETIRLISSEGRKFGLGLCVVSQRPSLVQKSILAQCSTQIIMKITNPNDLRAVVNSLEGVTPETENEIQNLPVGTALICGVVDRPLVVTIRPRKSKHGGHAVDILGQTTQVHEEEEYHQDVIEEVASHEGMLPLIMPKLSLRDIELMSNAPILKVTTYLIPAAVFVCRMNGQEFSVLLDRIKGKVIVDPDNDRKIELMSVGPHAHFGRAVEFTALDHDVKLDEKISVEVLKGQLGRYVTVEDSRECFIVYRSVEYGK
ncbi:ATP-binding protein [Candidatus Woesearchaeota archaeon]|nr:ATP-binding protein [Candidatus Woesearchaeota archaeon]